MSSFNIRDIREIPNEPMTKFANRMAKRLAKFINKDQMDKLEGKEDIYSAGQDVETVIKWHSELSSTTYFDGDTQYFSPSEPNYTTLKVWIQGNNIGEQLDDISGFDHHGQVPDADLLLVDGDPFDYGIHWGGTKSVATRFNRPTSPVVNEEHLTVPDHTDLDSTGISTGMSFFIRFKIFDLTAQNGSDRTLFSKMDDSTPNNGYQSQVTSTGRIQFHIKLGGTNNNYQTATSTVAAGETVYEVWFTYNVGTDTAHIYVNNVDKSLTNPGNPTWPDDLTDHSLKIFQKGEQSDGDRQGVIYGDLYDFMLWKEQVISTTEVGRHYTNKWTIADIPFGQVMVGNYWATYSDEVAILQSFTSTSFTSTSFTTV